MIALIFALACAPPSAAEASPGTGSAPVATPQTSPGPTPPHASPGPPPSVDALPSGDYAALVRAIEADRLRLAASGDHAAARTYLRRAITEHLFPAWRGTRWAFYGMAEAPGEGTIACGYWVASVLRDAGFRIQRNEVGKQASERILLTYAEPARLKHFGSRPVSEVIAAATRAGVGLWGVGLANHTGFLWNDGEQVRFCHSNYNGYRGPECEIASESWAFQTSYTVIASLLEDATLDAWLEGRALPTGRFADGG